MFEKLEELYKKYLELTDLISDPEVIADQASWRKYMKEQSSMKDVVDKYLEYKKVVEDMESAKETINVVEIAVFICLYSFAPKYWEMTTEQPILLPTAMAINIIVIG